ncbi:hypothetical protein A7X92_11715 [Stenotrophomonas maltophilia]|nr:hypothetical protein A7X92_11715 [Stenotrophomonas maltophilia]
MAGGGFAEEEVQCRTALLRARAANAMPGFLAEHALDRLDTRLCQNNSATVVGIGNGKRQAASLQLNVSTASQWLGVILDSIERSHDTTFGMSDSHPAKVDPGETFQGLDLSDMPLVVLRNSVKKIPDSFVRDRRRTSQRSIRVEIAVDQPDLDGVSQCFYTCHHSIEGVRVIQQRGLTVSRSLNLVQAPNHSVLVFTQRSATVRRNAHRICIGRVCGEE